MATSFGNTPASLRGAFFGGKATRKEVKIEFGPSGTPAIHLVVFIPNQRQGPAPVFLALNAWGNQSVVKEPGVRVTQSWVSRRCPCPRTQKKDA